MNKSIRNSGIVALCAVGGGWLGVWLNAVTGNTAPPLESLGALVWLVLPALMGLLLRAWGGDGWGDAGLRLHLRAQWRWYVAAVFLYPLLTLLMLGVAWGLGAIKTTGWGGYTTAVAIMAAGSLMKNVFEELAWRGYLTPRLAAAGVHPLLNHALVAVVWWAWHLPYYYFFFDQAVLHDYISTSLPVFLLMALVVLFPTALLFGELRLASRSVWPPFLLHVALNGVSMPLIINGFIELQGTLGIVFSPTNEGLVMALLLGLAGWVLYRRRVGNLV